MWPIWNLSKRLKVTYKVCFNGGPLFYGHHNFWIRNQHQPIALRLYSYYFFIYFLLVLSLMRIFELQSLMCRVMSIDGLSFKKKRKKKKIMFVMSWWLRKETCVECVIFPYHFKGEGILLKCRNNRRKTAMVYWHTGCKFSYRPQTIYFWNNQPIYIYRLIISKINNDIDDWKSWKNLFQLESSLLKEEFILIKKKTMDLSNRN